MVKASCGATRAMERRGVELNNKLFQGRGIDIGAGTDGISNYGINCYSWDMKDGDAQYLAKVPNASYDFVHSSHCLEHMVDVKVAIQNWVRVCKPNGYITIVIPDEELYERNNFPFKFNLDHKWSFRIYSGNPLHGKSINVLDMLKWVWKDTEILQITRAEDGFDWMKHRDIDQTVPEDGPECSIEIILRKK